MSEGCDHNTAMLQMGTLPDTQTKKIQNGESEFHSKMTKENQKNVTWKEFCQSTTLHGVNKIVEDTPYIFRRIFWVCIVLGGLTLFILQLIQNIRLFLQYPVTVNVKINYNDTLTFPAVTICNQNDFRTTAADVMNKYHVIRDFYSHLYDKGIDVTAYGVGNITLDDVYEMAAHNKEDLIVDCEWIGQKCDIGKDIAQTVTDYGYCYTFNSGRNNTHIRNLTSTGADLGLRLILNIEQYEYMRGPNTGAGIKVLLHDATEIPLVRDLGQAIPPGSHAFVGVQILKVNNLPFPHGICNDSAKLHFYDPYSIAACMLERKEKYIMNLCHCRDVYMSPDSTGYPPVCSLDQYQSCYVRAVAEYNQQSNHESCPMPCHRSMYDATITYASISNYDTDYFLKSKNIASLRTKYLHARETIQRVDEEKRATDKRLFHDLNMTFSRLTEKVFNHYKSTMNDIEDDVTNLVQDLNERKKFHLRWGLEKLLYTVEHNFIRGYEVMEERTFSIATSYYQDTMNYVMYVLPIIADSSTDADLRKAYFVQAEAKLQQHRSIAIRALDNMTQIYEAYKTSTPLLDYKVSPQSRYDLAYVTPAIVKEDDEHIDTNVERARQRLGIFIERIDDIQNDLNAALANSTINITMTQAKRKDFEYRARSFNLYKFKIKTRVIDASREICENLISHFTKIFDQLTQKADEISSFFHNTRKVLDKSVQQWDLILKLKDDALRYLDHGTMTKAELAKFGTSDEVIQNLNYLRAFFSDLRSRFSSVSSLLMQFKIKMTIVWENLLEAKVLYPFYSMIKTDLDTLQISNDTLNLRKIIRYMINEAYDWSLKNDDLNNDTLKQHLYKLTNADLVTMNATVVLSNIEEIFTALQLKTSAEHSISDEEAFIQAFADVQTMLQSYQQLNVIDSNFFKENFIEVDVFMKELSYEQVDQQIAYDQTALWSDIGGSLGLFIGASVITLLELFDFWFIGLVNCLKNRRNR